MAGIRQDVLYGTNVDFSNVGLPAPTLLTDGQMLIATTAANAGGTHINVGTITSTGGSVTISYDTPNINLEVAGGAAVTNVTSTNLERTVAGSSIDLEDLRFTTAYVVDPSVTTGSKANYSTVTAAVAAAGTAGGGKVFIRANTAPYVESFNLPTNVTLCSYGSDLQGGCNATISGQITVTATGSAGIANVNLHGNGVDPSLLFSGSNSVFFTMQNVIFTSNTVAAIQGTNANANILSINCIGIGDVGDFFDCTDLAASFSACQFLNQSGNPGFVGVDVGLQFGNSSMDTFLTVSGTSALSINNSQIKNNITVSGASQLGIEYSSTQSIALNGTTQALLAQVDINAGSSPGITIAAGVVVTADMCSINSSNTNAVDGTGTFRYSAMSFTGSSSTINATLTTQLLGLRPYASTTDRGVASFNPVDFTVDSDGEVSLIPSDRFAWHNVSVSTTLVSFNGYYAISPGGVLSFTLPPVGVLGDTIKISLSGATGWIIAQPNAGSQIRYGSVLTTVGVTGQLASTAQGDSLELVARDADFWQVQNDQGNFLYV